MQTDAILDIMSTETGISRNQLIMVASDLWPTMCAINAYLPIRMIESFERMLMIEIVKREIGWSV